MEQIFMIEVFIKRVVLKVEPPEKTPSELELEEIKRKQEEAAAAAAAAAALLKKKNGKKAKKKKTEKKGKKGKKGKKKKKSKGLSDDELKLLQACCMQMTCLPIFDFYVSHDNFVAPPPPPKQKKKKKGKKGKKAKPKPKKGKKGKKGKGKKKKGPLPRIINLPSEPLPQPPFFGVGNTVIFTSRPSKLKEIFESTPINITVWNRDVEMECVGFCSIKWHTSFFETLEKSAELNPVDMDAGEFRNTKQPEIITHTVEMVRPLRCEEDLKPSGEVEVYMRLSCLGNRVLSYFVALPEMDRLPGRFYLNDELKLKDVEVVRHWPGTTIDLAPPVAYFFSAPDITRSPLKVPIEPEKVFEFYVAPFTSDELAILSMGFPKGPCGGTNCPRRMDYRGSQHQFIYGEMDGKVYKHGTFVNKRDVHGPCGRLDCPLAKKVRDYICNEGMYKSCKKPCPKEYY